MLFSFLSPRSYRFANHHHFFRHLDFFGITFFRFPIYRKIIHLWNTKIEKKVLLLLRLKQNNVNKVRNERIINGIKVCRKLSSMFLLLSRSLTQSFVRCRWKPLFNDIVCHFNIQNNRIFFLSRSSFNSLKLINCERHIVN